MKNLKKYLIQEGDQGIVKKEATYHVIFFSAQHAVKETEFLRLKRSKISVEDFDPLKVIGRGAFGEVRKSYFEV